MLRQNISGQNVCLRANQNETFLSNPRMIEVRAALWHSICHLFITSWALMTFLTNYNSALFEVHIQRYTNLA